MYMLDEDDILHIIQSYDDGRTTIEMKCDSCHTICQFEF